MTIKSINNNLKESAMVSITVCGNRRGKPLVRAGLVTPTGHVQLVKK